MDSLDLNLKKYDRVFTFGCSFTQYWWATWADIIRLEVGSDKLFNYGRAGSGNFFICNSVAEADYFHNMTSNDLVMVMFTNVNREDRIVNSNWITPGNIYSQDLYDKGFMNYWDDSHGLLRDITLIKMLKGFLLSKKIDHHFMSMVPLMVDMNGDDALYPDKLVSYSNEVRSWIKPSIFENIFNNDWHSIQPRSITKRPGTRHPVKGIGWYEDNHAHPKEYLAYLQKLWPQTTFSQATIEQVDKWHEEVIQSTEQKHFVPNIQPERIFY